MYLYPFRLKRRTLRAIPLILLTAVLLLPGCAGRPKERARADLRIGRGKPPVSDDGEEYLAEESGGVLHLSPDGVPTWVESPASDGILRTSVITCWEQKDSPNSNEA